MSKLMASFTMKRLAGIEWKYLPVIVRNTAKLKDFVDHVMPMIRPTWKGADVAVKTVNTGLGLTNHLIGFYNETANDPEEDIIILRVNGNNTDLFIDREREIYLRCLFSSANLGPPVYCEFENGLCYRYIPGKPLEHKQLSDPHILRKIAALFALFHTYKLPEQFSTGQAVIPITLVDSMFSIITDAMYKLPRFKEAYVSKEALLKEFDDMKRLLSGFSSPVVLCHNDLQPGNIIISKDDGKVVFIDLEYAGLNYTACEIGDFFCEYGGIDNPDYTRCPNKEEQKRFIKMYLEEVNILKGAPEPSDKEVEDFCIEVNQGMVVMHFLWTVWSIAQSVLYNEHISQPTAPPTGDFNYLEYSIVRYKEYWKMKREFCSNL